MDIFDEDLLNYWRCLNKNGVKYIMVGGVAVNLCGYNRATDDIDVWINDTSETVNNIGKHLKNIPVLIWILWIGYKSFPGGQIFSLKAALNWIYSLT